MPRVRLAITRDDADEHLQFLYACPACSVRLNPKEGDCCEYDRPKQLGQRSCWCLFQSSRAPSGWFCFHSSRARFLW
jgi:hypothetical protein